MTTLYTDFLPEVQPHCDGAAEIMVVNAIRNAVIEFCERSWVWMYDTTIAALTASTQDYTLTVPTGTSIAAILDAHYGGLPIEPVTRANVFDRCPKWQTQTGTSVKNYLASEAATKVSVIPIPSVNVLAANGITFGVALKPTRASVSFSATWIYERYLEDITQGALWRMYAMPKKAWTNNNLAGMHRKAFDDAIATARVESSRSFTRAHNRNQNTGVARW